MTSSWFPKWPVRRAKSSTTVLADKQEVNDLVVEHIDSSIAVVGADADSLGAWLRSALPLRWDLTTVATDQDPTVIVVAGTDPRAVYDARRAWPTVPVIVVLPAGIRPDDELRLYDSGADLVQDMGPPEVLMSYIASLARRAEMTNTDRRPSTDGQSRARHTVA